DEPGSTPDSDHRPPRSRGGPRVSEPDRARGAHSGPRAAGGR
ncbi:MAG: hypothetical protein AVDCRST_MAG17-1017, partial [uncultured Solirubrobacterales bacterium]